MTEPTALEQQILEILSEVSAVPVAEIKPGDALGPDLGMDSVASMELLGMLDETFGIEIELEEAQNITDVRSVLAVARERLKHVV